MSVSPAALVSRTEALSKAIAQVRYDLTARAQTLGPGVDSAFRFVRDQIRFEAYPGVLRGAEGSYITRAGNAFDRSLVLADMLKRKGLRTRFAVGKLPRAQAERLFTRIFAPAPALEADAVSKVPAGGQPEGEVFMARLRARAMRDYAAIRKALGNGLPAKATPSREEVLREIEGHVWVQAEVNGRWVDLDSAFADAAPGRAYALAERTVDTLPKESYQRVTIRVTSETLTGSSLKSEIALQFSAAANELLDRQVFLTHVPGGGGGGLAGAMAGATMGKDSWSPMLWVDGEFHLGKPILFSEQIKPVERGRPPRGGLGGLFGAGGALSAASQFVAEWLEFEIAFPDGRREVTRRALIDRAGTAWRQAGKPDAAALRPLSRDADGLTAPRALHNIWFSAGGHDLAGYADAARLFAHRAREIANQSRSTPPSVGSPQGPAPSPTFEEQVWSFALTNFTFLVRSDHAVVPALNDSPSLRFYADSPRILIVSIGPMAGAGGAAGIYLEGDLRRDPLRALAREPSAEAGAVERKIWFGVLQGALEHETAAADMAAAGGDRLALVSTSSLLTGEGVVVLRPVDAARAGELAASKETAASAAHALASGNTLVVPKGVLRGGPLGWWEIGSDGTTRAVLMGDLGGWRRVPGVGRDPWGNPLDWIYEPDRPPVRPPDQIGPQNPGEVTQPGHKWPPKEWLKKPSGAKDECKKKGGSLSTPGIRVAMASPLPSGLIDGHGRESVRSPLLLAQTSTEYTLVTECVAKPAVGVAALVIPILAFVSLAIGAAVLGYLIGSNL